MKGSGAMEGPPHILQYGVVWYGMVRCGLVWYGMVWYGMVRYGTVWYCMVWYGKKDSGGQ